MPNPSSLLREDPPNTGELLYMPKLGASRKKPCMPHQEPALDTGTVVDHVGFVSLQNQT
jgi:hypothetical protein